MYTLQPLCGFFPSIPSLVIHNAGFCFIATVLSWCFHATLPYNSKTTLLRRDSQLRDINITWYTKPGCFASFALLYIYLHIFSSAILSSSHSVIQSFHLIKAACSHLQRLLLSLLPWVNFTSLLSSLEGALKDALESTSATKKNWSKGQP